MKKYFLLGGITASMCLTSCFKDNENTATQTFSAGAINIITSLNDGTVVTGTSYYGVSLELMQRTGSVECNDLIFNNTSYKFTTDDMEFKSPYGTEVYFDNPTGFVNGNSSLPLQNDQFIAIAPVEISAEEGYGYYYNGTNAGDYTFYVNNYFPWRMLAKYNIGEDYRVNTFLPDTFFKGITKTSYTVPTTGDISTYITDNITYRLIIDLENKKSTMLIYNAKFSSSEREPVKAVILVEDLAYEFTANGIKVSGEDIIPQIFEAGEYTPYPNFKFDSLEFSTIDEYYTQAHITYLVAGMYNGEFTGSYINSFYIK